MASFQLKETELDSPADGIRRIAHERLEKVDDALSDIDSDLNEGVHTARKQLKKARAVIRLVRPEVGKDVYDAENKCYRDAGRLLAPFRDAWVRLKLTEQLAEDQDDETLVEALQISASRLRADYEKAIKDDDVDDVVDEVAGMIDKARDRIDDWLLENERGSGLFRKGLKKVYKRGKKGLRRALIHPSVENLHEWRKRCKYLRYHVDILRPAWPDQMELLENSLHRLTDLLGDDHDLAVLRESINSDLRDDLSDDQLQNLNASLDDQHRDFADRAWPLGRRLYADKPKHFARRIAAFWNSNLIPQPS